MKVLVLFDDEWYDYDTYNRNVVGGVIVPDDFVVDDVRKQWDSETGISKTYKNQYGTWESKFFTEHSKSFYDWITERYEKVEIFEYDV